MERYEDPQDPLNATSYHTGKTCIEKGCSRPAGTHWSPFWCQQCNAARMRRISGALKPSQLVHQGAVPAACMPPDMQMRVCAGIGVTGTDEKSPVSIEYQA